MIVASPVLVKPPPHSHKAKCPFFVTSNVFLVFSKTIINTSPFHLFYTYIIAYKLIFVKRIIKIFFNFLLTLYAYIIHYNYKVVKINIKIFLKFYKKKKK